MYPVSQQYTDFLQRRDRLWVIKVEIDGVEYGSTEIVDFEIENSLALGEEFELGTAILSKLTLTMRTTDTIPPNAKVVPYLALDMSGMTWGDADYTWDEADWPWLGGVTEWLPLGEFYIDSRDQVNNVWVFVCYDKLVWADVPYISALAYPATMQDVWDEICDSLDYTYDSTVVIDESYQIEVGPAGYSKRQVLGYIAAANSASVYVGKDGVLKFRRFTAADEPIYDMGASNYVRAIQTNPVKTYTRIVVTYDDEGSYYEAGTGDDNHTLYLENPFATQAIVDDLLTALNGFAYMPIQMDARGYPQIEAGDRLNFTRAESLTWDEADFTWEDADVPWDGNQTYQTNALHTVFGFNGGLKMIVEAPSKSDQQSEFQVDGTLTTAVNRLNQTAVKLGKPYFGVTITKEEGIVIERSDHASKVILNSDDLLDWTVGGVRKLYYDADDDAIKFIGTIEASVFDGGEIYGAYIATSQSYPRAEMSNTDNLFGVYKDADHFIFITPIGDNPSIQISDNAGSRNLLLYNTSALSAIDATGSLQVGATLGDLILKSLSGYVKVDSWSKLYSSGTSGTLQSVIDSLQSQINSKANAFSGLNGRVYVAVTDGGPAEFPIDLVNGVAT